MAQGSRGTSSSTGASGTGAGVGLRGRRRRGRPRRLQERREGPFQGPGRRAHVGHRPRELPREHLRRVARHGRLDPAVRLGLRRREDAAHQLLLVRLDLVVRHAARVGLREERGQLPLDFLRLALGGQHGVVQAAPQRVRPERLAREALEQAPGLLDRRAADPELGRPGRLEVRLVHGHVGRPRGAGPGQRQARPRPQQVVGALVPRRRQRPDRLLAALGPVLAGPLLVDAGPLLVLPELGDHDRDAAVRALHEVLLAVGRERRELRPPLPAPRRLPVVVRRARRRDGRVRQQAVERPGVRGRAARQRLAPDGLLLPFVRRRLLRPARRVRRVEAVALLAVARQPQIPPRERVAERLGRRPPVARRGLREAALPHVALPEHDHPRRRPPAAVEVGRQRHGVLRVPVLLGDGDAGGVRGDGLVRAVHRPQLALRPPEGGLDLRQRQLVGPLREDVDAPREVALVAPAAQPVRLAVVVVVPVQVPRHRDRQLERPRRRGRHGRPLEPRQPPPRVEVAQVHEGRRRRVEGPEPRLVQAPRALQQRVDDRRPLQPQAVGPEPLAALPPQVVVLLEVAPPVARGAQGGRERRRREPRAPGPPRQARQRQRPRGPGLVEEARHRVREARYRPAFQSVRNPTGRLPWMGAGPAFSLLVLRYAA